MASHATRRKPRLPHPSLLKRNLFVRTAVAVLAAAGIVFFSGAAAHAEPSPADYEKQIDAAWNQLEPVIEQHNATKTQLNQSKAKAQQLQQQIQPLAQQVDAAMSTVGELAAHAYMGGGKASTLTALLNDSSPTAFMDQLSLLDQYARIQSESIRNVQALKAQYEVQKAPLDKLVEELSRTEADLAAKEKQINTDINSLQQLRLKAYGSGGGIGELKPVPCPLTYPGGKAGIAVKFACDQIGKPYVFGAEGPNSFDCSGLTLAAWARAGVSMPHNAAAQKRSMPSVSRANLRPGDLVFYYSDVHHVAMYVGGDWIVHASQAGVPIKMRKMDNGAISGFGRPAN